MNGMIYVRGFRKVALRLLLTSQEAAETALECLKIPMIIKGRTLVIPNDMQIGYSFGLMMPYQGSNVSVHEWEVFCESERKLGKGDSCENIIRGVYGIL